MPNIKRLICLYQKYINEAHGLPEDWEWEISMDPAPVFVMPRYDPPPRLKKYWLTSGSG